MKSDSQLHVSTHAIQRWRERLGTDGHDRIVRKLRSIVSKGKVCWPKPDVADPMLCPTCFILRAEKAGMDKTWMLLPK